jgi:hypothetical protein
VNYQNVEHARAAIQEKNGIIVNGKRIKVEMFKTQLIPDSDPVPPVPIPVPVPPAP